MISPSVFEKHKCDSESLKSVFNKPSADYAEGPKRLINLLRNRTQEGRLGNLRDYRIYAAIDMAYDVSLDQTTPTLLRNLVNKHVSYDETMKAVQSWGLTNCNLFCDRQLPNGKVEKILNPPTFFHVLVPLVKSYVTIRLAKLFNDRNNTPLFKFEPLKDTAPNRVACEVITDITQAMTAQFGYASDLKGAILKMLLYSVCIQFPKEAWYHEAQENAKGEMVTVREGLRYVQPHPTRLFWDQMHGPNTFNTDSGCTYAGYWAIQRFSDLYDDKLLWNRDTVGIGKNWFENSLAGTYFTEVYPCVLRFPTVQGVLENDRETTAYYSATSDLDKAVFVTEHFMKLVPKDFGMGDYTSPVWFRFKLAGDDTILWCEPLAYSPAVFFGYDYDNSRSRNPSMALEILPFQDHLGNVLSQILLTVKQNLANVIFFDKNVVNADNVRGLQNSGELMYRGLNFIEYDSFKNSRAGVNVGEAFKPVQLHFASTTELTNTISTIISILERLLVMSAQEIGGAAAHQQSAQEIRTISDNTSSRVAYTGSFVDEAIDAEKKQLYEASMAYMDRDYVSMVSSDIPNLDKVLDKLGMVSVDEAPGRRQVTGSLDNLVLEGFSSQRDGPDRGSDTQTATTLMQTVQAVAGNQMLAQAVGVPAILQLLSQAARLGGAPRDFELRATESGEAPPAGPAPEEILKIVNEQLAKPLTEAMLKDREAAQAGIQQVGEAMTQAHEEIGAALAGQQKQLQETQQVLMQLAETFKAASQAPPLAPPGQYDSMPAVPPDPGSGYPPAELVQQGGPPLI